MITTDPVRHLEVNSSTGLVVSCNYFNDLCLPPQSQIRDLLRTIIGLTSVPVPGQISFGQVD